jgi:hypothetical protein
MPMVYSLSKAMAGYTATHATPDTETEVFFMKAGVRNAALQAMYVIGKGAGLTAISGISFRVVKFTTASTSGTGITPTPKDPGMQAAKQTAASAPTAGRHERTCSSLVAARLVLADGLRRIRTR